MDAQVQVDSAPAALAAFAVSGVSGKVMPAPLAGNVFQVLVSPGQSVAEGDVVIVLEAMKMETEIRANQAGNVSEIHVSEGDVVNADDPLITLA